MSDREKNVLLHQAVVAGYLRVCRKAASLSGESVSLREISDHATAHLARPEFAAVRNLASIEIFEFVKDGLLNGADRKIHDALEGRHDRFWAMANRSLEAMGCPPVAPTEIDEELLALD